MEADQNGVEPSDTNGMVASTTVSDEAVAAFDASFANAKAAVATLLTTQYRDSGYTFQTGFQALKATDEWKNLDAVVKGEMGPEEAQLKKDVIGLYKCATGSVTFSGPEPAELFATIGALEGLAEQYLSGDINAVVGLIDYLSK